MAAGAPVEDVRPETVRALLRVLGENERLVEEHDRIVDARLLVADDADEEHDLGAVDVGEPGREGEGRRVLEDGHRLLQPARSDERPCLSSEGVQRERRCGAGGETSHPERGERLVVPVLLEELLGGARVRLDALGVGPAEAVLEVMTVGVEPAREPLEGLARRTGLAALDLADVLLREPSGGELRLAQTGRMAQQANALPESGRAGVERRLPVLPRHRSHGGTSDGVRRVRRHDRRASS